MNETLYAVRVSNDRHDQCKVIGPQRIPDRPRDGTTSQPRRSSAARPGQPRTCTRVPTGGRRSGVLEIDALMRAVFGESSSLLAWC
jgi:hypothetical protein